MSESVNEVCIKLRFLLEKAVQKNLTDGLLFSGGLDTSILATVASKFTSLKAFTCAFQGAPAPDIECAKLMATRLKLRHYIHYFNEDELFEVIPLVVKTLQLFDPMEVRNSLTVFIASKFAKERLSPWPGWWARDAAKWRAQFSVRMLLPRVKSFCMASR